MIHNDLIFSATEFCEEISRKSKELSEEMSHGEWKEYAEVLDVSYPVMQEELVRMKKQYWDSKKVGTRVKLYSDPHLQEYKNHIVNGSLQTKDEYIELYDPIQECWRDLKNRIYRETLFPLIREPVLIDDVFLAHLIYASMAYQWGQSVMSENERIAFEALNISYSLFDKCIGMVWFKVYADKQKELSRTRVKAGKKGGKSKAEVYIVIQNKLVDLINTLSPKGGWKSKAAAVNTLIDPLWEFVEESNFVINNQSKKYRLSTTSQDALADTILKSWSRDVESVRQAFDNNIIRKKRISA